MKDQTLLVSIVVPFFNAYRYLQRCIESILNQTYECIELLLIDDGSDDESLSMCRRYEENDERVKVFVLSENKGQASARKVGIENAHGSYIMFIDSDDWIEKEAVSQCIDIVRKTGAELIVSDFIWDYENGDSYVTRASEFSIGFYEKNDKERIVKNLIKEDHFVFNGAPWSKLYAHDLVDRIMDYYDEGIRKYGDDWELVFPMIIKARSIYISEKTYYHKVDRVDSVSYSRYENWYEYLSKCFVLLKKVFVENQCLFLLEGLERIYFNELLINVPHVINYELPMWCFRGIDVTKTTVLYGAGLIGKTYYKQFKVLGFDSSIVGWIDQKEYGKEIEGVVIAKLSDVISFHFEQIVIAIYDEAKAEEASDQLTQQGVPRERIVWKRPEKLSLVLEDIYQI